MRRSHARRAALTAGVIELIIIALVSNQWATDRLSDHPSYQNRAATSILSNAALSSAWRVSPRSALNSMWLGGVVADGAIVVATALLVFLVVAALRRPAPFFAAWFASWALVISVTVLAGVGRVAIAYDDYGANVPDVNHGRFWFAVQHGPTYAVVVFGVLSGLLAGLGAAIAARTAGALPPAPAAEPVSGEVAPEPAPPPPWYGEPDEVITARTEQPTRPVMADDRDAHATQPFRRDDAHATQVISKPDTAPNDTQQLPRS